MWGSLLFCETACRGTSGGSRFVNDMTYNMSSRCRVIRVVAAHPPAICRGNLSRIIGRNSRAPLQLRRPGGRARPNITARCGWKASMPSTCRQLRSCRRLDQAAFALLLQPARQRALGALDRLVVECSAISGNLSLSPRIMRCVAITLPERMSSPQTISASQSAHSRLPFSHAPRRMRDTKRSILSVMTPSNSAALLGISRYSVLVETPARRATLSMEVAASPLEANSCRAASRIATRVSWSGRACGRPRPRGVYAILRCSLLRDRHA